MAIEGPLRELGLHDLFQLLDLSRKTGTLTVTSSPRDNEGSVQFRGGAVVRATIRGIRCETRAHVEDAVFKLFSWPDGHFSFEGKSFDGPPTNERVQIAIGSLLMEAARRADEWKHIESHVPHLEVVPALAQAGDASSATLDLRPNEWEVLSEVDASRDVRAIAHALGGSAFGVAKIVYGLACTGIIELSDPWVKEANEPSPPVETRDRNHIPTTPAGDILRRVERNTLLVPIPDPHLALGRLLEETIDGWERVLVESSDARQVARVRVSVVVATRLRELLNRLPDEEQLLEESAVVC